MNADLEATVNELGPEYRELVARLKSPFAQAPARTSKNPDTQTPFFFPRPLLIAASFFVVVGLAVLFQPRPTTSSSADARSVYTVAYASTEEALALIVASQRADGSWDNDFLTRQNAAALRRSDDTCVRLAYRRAVRYLRFRGLAPLTDDELKARGESAANLLAQI